MKSVNKILSGLGSLLLFSLVMAVAIGNAAFALPIAAVGFGGAVILGMSDFKASLFTITPGIDQIATELGNYFRVNNHEVSAMVYQQAQAEKYMRVIPSVKGKYPALHSVTGHVVQGFASAWNPIGQTKFKTNPLVAYHQKVNFKITPSEILPSWLGELYNEKMTPEQMPISQYIMNNELKPAVTRDIDYLMGNGVYDANDLATFGKSMDGIKTLLAAGVASSSQPMYKIPLATLTDDNIVAQVEYFESKIPISVRGFVDKIYMSTANRDRYRLNYRNRFGLNNDFAKDATTFTYTGERQIIGLNCLNGSNVIFSTPDKNFVKMIDLYNAPEINSIQVLDYDIKLFMEFWLGIGFSMNQLVMVSVTNGSGSGLTSEQTTYFLDNELV